LFYAFWLSYNKPCNCPTFARNSSLASSACFEISCGVSFCGDPCCPGCCELPFGAVGDELPFEAVGDELPFGAVGDELPFGAVGDELPFGPVGDELPF
jgi:hypothetical protein